MKKDLNNRTKTCSQVIDKAVNCNNPQNNIEDAQKFQEPFGFCRELTLGNPQGVYIGENYKDQEKDLAVNYPEKSHLFLHGQANYSSTPSNNDDSHQLFLSQNHEEKEQEPQK